MAEMIKYKCRDCGTTYTGWSTKNETCRLCGGNLEPVQTHPDLLIDPALQEFAQTMDESLQEVARRMDQALQELLKPLSPVIRIFVKILSIGR